MFVCWTAESEVCSPVERVWDDSNVQRKSLLLVLLSVCANVGHSSEYVGHSCELLSFFLQLSDHVA